MIFKQKKKIIPHVWERPTYILNIFMMKWNDFSTNYNMYILFHCMNFFHPIDTIKTEFVIVRSSTNFLFAATWFFNSIGRRTRVGTNSRTIDGSMCWKRLEHIFAAPLKIYLVHIQIVKVYTYNITIFKEKHHFWQR